MDDTNAIFEFLQNGKHVLDILRGIKDLLPAGAEADKAQEQINQAERALAASEAELAKALGYKLCQCTFPPQIMLSVGRHAEHDNEIFKCPKCEKQEPSERYFQQQGRITAHNHGGPSWVNSRGRR